MSSIDQVVKLFSLTDGRDKSYKRLQGLTKALAFFLPDKSTATKMDNLSKSIGEGRSIMRFAKWTTNIQKFVKISKDATDTAGWNQARIIEFVRVLGDMGYVIGDNMAYFSKYKILPTDQKACAKYAMVSQFWGFFCQIILDVIKIVTLAPTASAATREEAFLNLTKDLADILVVLSVVGYLPTSIYNLNGGVQGILLTLSGAIATYQNWGKAAPAPAAPAPAAGAGAAAAAPK